MKTKTVLIVDDEKNTREGLARALQNAYRVLSAESGEKALEVLAAEGVDLVLSDVRMPGMDGCELTRRLRERYGDAMVLIAVSGSDPDDARVSQTFDSVDHYFRKPVDLAALRRLLSL